MKEKLFNACVDGKVGIVKEILDQGIDPSLKGEHGRTPMLLACYNGKVDVVNLLLEKDANPNFAC